ncbi:MAG: histidinol dehydrogenase [Bacteroidales bacterium]|nr:histidinol dehydrogenase [Bacteroidales bacterium]
MQLFRFPDRNEWPKLLARPVSDDEQIGKTVKRILSDVKRNGDAALKKYTERYDGFYPESLEISHIELEEAEKAIDEKLKKAIALAAENIEVFHRSQLHPRKKIITSPGVECWQKDVPIEKIGLYIPGGTAPLFSTVLMLGIPARIAGCREIILCSPPRSDGNIHPAILYSARLAGINRVFTIGGAQAIAAMAYGTKTIPRVYKIFGPGNQFVTIAKQMITHYGVAIDMPAGPSEVAVMADDTAEPAFVAADLLSQAEHGPDSQVLLVSNNEPLVHHVIKEVERQVKSLSRGQYAMKALENSRIILLRDNADMIDLINDYAPEHLIVAVKDADSLVESITNAGSVFIGNYTPESAGDYVSGTNHTLPTHGYAKSYSGVNMDSFIKKITFQKISPDGLRNIGPAIIAMAEAEELTAHKNAVLVRIQEKEKK